MRTRLPQLVFSALVSTTLLSSVGLANPVPGYVPPVEWAQVPQYADDQRGVYVPAHPTYRLKTDLELKQWSQSAYPTPLYQSPQSNPDAYERQMNNISNGFGSFEEEMNRIATDPGVMAGGQGTNDAHLYANNGMPTEPSGYGMAPQMAGYVAPQGNGCCVGNASGYASTPTHYQQPMQLAQAPMQQQPYMQQQPPMRPATPPYPANALPTGDEGIELVAGTMSNNTSVDMHNSLVRLQEERISIRRALQRMMDQVGAGDWAVVWDLAEQNAGLPDMEISIYSEEPFINVLNALLARIQTRSGQPLRVIRYDRSKRLVVTDRAGGHRLAGDSSPAGVGKQDNVLVSENVLKEAMVSLHYDEIPLVDALENIVGQAGRDQWRLRMYAGKDQVLKPAHIEEPFNVAMERLLRLFNLKFEIFPGGKLIVVTHNNRFGYKGGE